MQSIGLFTGETIGRKFKTACALIHAEGYALDENLVSYGQSPEDVNQLKTEIDEYAAVIAAPRSAIVTRAQARQELTELVNQANDLLRNKVGRLIKLFETDNPKLYTSYKVARVIVDLRAGKQVVEEE